MKLVWTEFAADGTGPIRIFENLKIAVRTNAWDAGLVRKIPKQQAVESIRRKVFARAEYRCENPRCRKPVTWDSGEMHEKIWQGCGGEQSVDNGICLCHHCHHYDKEYGHGERQLQFTKRSTSAT